MKQDCQEHYQLEFEALSKNKEITCHPLSPTLLLCCQFQANSDLLISYNARLRREVVQSQRQWLDLSGKMWRVSCRPWPGSVSVGD